MKKVFEIAIQYYGVREIAGAKHNPIIVDFFKRVTGHDEPDETAWCAAYVGASLIEAGLKSSGKLNARSYLNWGRSVKDTPEIGDIGVLWRGTPTSWMGHVAFYVGQTKTNYIFLGGNQNNEVSIAPYPKLRILDFRRRIDTPEFPIEVDNL